MEQLSKLFAHWNNTRPDHDFSNPFSRPVWNPYFIALKVYGYRRWVLSEEANATVVKRVPIFYYDHLSLRWVGDTRDGIFNDNAYLNIQRGNLIRCDAIAGKEENDVYVITEDRRANASDCEYFQESLAKSMFFLMLEDKTFGKYKIRADAPALKWHVFMEDGETNNIVSLGSLESIDKSPQFKQLMQAYRNYHTSEMNITACKSYNPEYCNGDEYCYMYFISHQKCDVIYKLHKDKSSNK